MCKERDKTQSIDISIVIPALKTDVALCDRKGFQ